MPRIDENEYRDARVAVAGNDRQSVDSYRFITRGREVSSRELTRADLQLLKTQG